MLAKDAAATESRTWRRCQHTRPMARRMRLRRPLKGRTREARFCHEGRSIFFDRGISQRSAWSSLRKNFGHEGERRADEGHRALVSLRSARVSLTNALVSLTSARMRDVRACLSLTNALVSLTSERMRA